MGFLKDVKTGITTDDAQKAIDKGHSVYTPKLNTPMTQHGLSGGIYAWAEAIDQIEAVGWKLDQWAVGSDEKGRPEAYPLFRRAVS